MKETRSFKGLGTLKIPLHLSEKISMESFVGHLKKLYKDEELRFRWSISLKVVLIPLLTYLSSALLIWVTLQFNYIFFKAFGVLDIDQLQGAYFDAIIGNTSWLLPYISFYLLIVIFSGLYVSKLMLRPFKLIGKFCEDRNKGIEAVYDPDFFTDLKILTGFSEYFFYTIEKGKLEGALDKVEVPQKFTRIHKPVFEQTFFLQYFLIFMISTIVVCSTIYITTLSVHAEIVRLSLENLKVGRSATYFLKNQSQILDTLLWLVIGFNILVTVLLSSSLYKMVATPAFGVFATMRSFLKGNRASRVHLIGHTYLRTQTRALNKYLENIEKELS